MISTFSIPSNFSRNIFHQSGAANFFLRIFSFEFFIRICILWPAKVEILSLLRVWGLSGWFRAVGSRGMRILWPQSRHLHCRENLPTIELTQNTFSSAASLHFCILGPAANKMYSYRSTFCNYWPTTLSSRVWGGPANIIWVFWCGDYSARKEKIFWNMLPRCPTLSLLLVDNIFLLPFRFPKKSILQTSHPPNIVG